MNHGDYTDDQLWDDLYAKFNDDWMITAASHSGGTDQDVNGLGLPYSHAYSVLGLY